MKIFHGIPISSGIAIGPIYYYNSEKLTVEKNACTDPEIEIKRLDTAILQARDQLHKVFLQTLTGTSKEIADIFSAQLLILDDPELSIRVRDLIKSNRFTAEYAWYSIISQYERMISSLDSNLFSERAMDIHDVGQRILKILHGKNPILHLRKPSIIAAKELSPSDTIGFDKNLVLAFCTTSGGPTSHVAILSKALGIPSVIVQDHLFKEIEKSTEVIIDGSSGIVVIEPDALTKENYFKESDQYFRDFEIALSKTDQPAISTDNHRFNIFANINSPTEIERSLEYGAEGAGLLRTEFIFIERDDLPSEEEQFTTYLKIFSQFGEKPVIVRTIDFGGDKPSGSLNIPRETNPFLGLRGTRLALKREDVFRTQLTALLRAGFGNTLKIMFPMIGSISELNAVKQQIAFCRSILDQKGTEYNSSFEIGLMIETPSSAIMADVFIKEVDFFSIGTNDLTQYTLAVDRTNSQVAEYADPLDPAVLRLINTVCNTAHQAGKTVGICGELASYPTAIPLLMGFHIDEFSMNFRSIPSIKQIIRNYSLNETEHIANHVISLSSAEEVHNFLNLTRKS